MRLKRDFITQNIDDTQFLVPVGGAGFKGVIRSNQTAAFIVDCLQEETSEAEIVDKLCAKYGAPRETVAADLEEILTILRSVRALEE